MWMCGCVVFEQLILEESFLKHRKLNEAMIIGFEGMWGSITLIAVMLPIMYAVPGQDNNWLCLFVLLFARFSCPVTLIAADGSPI